MAVSNESVETLDNLVDFGLLESSGLDRYTLHQTITEYARMTSNDNTAYERMVKYFVHYVETYNRHYRK